MKPPEESAELLRCLAIGLLIFTVPILLAWIVHLFR